MHQTALRVDKKADDQAMDARPSSGTNRPCGLFVPGLCHGLWSWRKPQPRVSTWARVAMPQTRFAVTTLRAGVPQAAGGSRNPLVVMDTTALPAPTPVVRGTLAQGRLIHG